MDADVAAVVKLVGVQVPTLDKPLGQHQGWTGEICVWKWQTFTFHHRSASIAHPGGARQAEAQRWAGGCLALNSKCEYNVYARLSLV